MSRLTTDRDYNAQMKGDASWRALQGLWTHQRWIRSGPNFGNTGQLTNAPKKMLQLRHLS